MAKIIKLKHTKVKGSTILEVVVSMVVIVFVIGIGLMILSNVTRLSLSARKLKTDALLQTQLTIISIKGNIRDTVFTTGELSIEQLVEKNGLGNHLYTVYLKAVDLNSDTISSLKGIILIHHDQ